jgi:hypothetical protein
MNGQITELLDQFDNVEKIRSNIAAILKTELVSQHQKATEQNLQDAADYKISVYLERERPWELAGDSSGNSPFPLVNIQLVGYRKDNGPGETVNRKKYIGEFFIDCYAKGSPENPDYFDDTDATIRAWKIERIIRNILMAGPYTYLGMRNIVRGREITEARTGAPTNITGNIEESAISVTICRIFMSVLFYEESPQVSGVEYDGMSFKASTTPEGEVILINI